MMATEATTYTDWVGKTETLEDEAAPAIMARLCALLDHIAPPWGADEVPPLGYWLYFLPQALQRDIATDGHPKLGGFLPPVPLPRRMWAGSRLAFHSPLYMGETMTRTSTIKAVTPKTGRSGSMIFVTVNHELSVGTRRVLTEIQDIVYREPAPATPGSETGKLASHEAEPRRQGDWLRTFTPDAALLFRFSALTFNAHRIHYDRAYAQKEEGYPGLVVHSPLTATLLMDLFLRNNPGKTVTSFTFKGVNPLFDGRPMTLQGVLKQAESGVAADLWATDDMDRICLSAELEAK